MPAMRLSSSNYMPDYGGKLPRNFVLQDVDTDTAKRWERNGIAVRDTGEDLAPLEGETPGVDALQSQIASLQRELEDARARETTARTLQEERAKQSELASSPFSPFEASLTDGRSALGDLTNADADDDETPDDEKPGATRRRVRRT